MATPEHNLDTRLASLNGRDPLFSEMILSLVTRSPLLGRVQLTRHVRSISTDRAALQLCIPAYFVWGANTAVGKTLISAGLAAAAVRMKVRGQVASISLA